MERVRCVYYNASIILCKQLSGGFPQKGSNLLHDGDELVLLVIRRLRNLRRKLRHDAGRNAPRALRGGLSLTLASRDRKRNLAPVLGKVLSLFAKGLGRDTSGLVGGQAASVVADSENLKEVVGVGNIGLKEIDLSNSPSSITLSAVVIVSCPCRFCQNSTFSSR